MQYTEQTQARIHKAAVEGAQVSRGNVEQIEATIYAVLKAYRYRGFFEKVGEVKHAYA